MKTIDRMRGMARLVFQGDTSALFEFVGDDVVPFANEDFKDKTKPLWLNLGYWTRPCTYPEACIEMARYLGDAARLSPSDHVLDVGFGFGEQHQVWFERFSPARIAGINVTPVQVEVATRLAHERGYGEKVDLRVGSATELPFADATFDKVTALECAFHFRTRDAFFREARRVLKPGGRIALIDMLPSPGTSWSGARRRVMRRLCAFADENMYDRNEYVGRLQAMGFSDVEQTSFREQVYPGFNAYLEERKRGRAMRDIVIDPASLARRPFSEHVAYWSQNLGIDDYVLFAATRGPR